MNSQQKSKKTLIAASVIAAVAIGWAGTTYVVGNSVEERLGTYINSINQKVQEEDIFVVKPKFVLNEVKKSFFNSEFTVSVQIENIEKISKLNRLESMKASGDSYYSAEEIKQKEDQLKTQPDFIHLFDIKNTAKHGPFPKIAQFNFTPALMSIDSVTTFNELNTTAKETAKQLSLDEKTLISIQNYTLLNAQSLVSFTGSIESKIQSNPFNWNIYDKGINYGGLTIDVTGSSDIEYKAQLGKTSLKTIPHFDEFSSQKEYEDAIAKIENNFIFDGLNLEGKYINGEFFTGNLNVSILPINYSDKSRVTDENNQPLTNKATLAGFDLTYKRSKNGDTLFNEEQSFTIKPISMNITEYDHRNYDTQAIVFNSSLIEGNSQAKNIPNNFLTAIAKQSNDRYKLTRNSLISGDSSELIETLDNPMANLHTYLEAYRALAGEASLAVKPFEVTFSKESSDPMDLDLKIGESSLSIVRESTDLNKPLLINSKINTIDISSKSEEFKATTGEFSFDLTLPLQNLYPFNLGYSLSKLDLAVSNNPLFSANELKAAIGLAENETSVDVYEQISGKQITFNSVELGDFDVKETLTNWNKEGVNKLQGAIVEGIEVALNDAGFGETSDILMMAMLSQAPEIVESLSANGPGLTISPFTFSSTAGKADASLAVSLKPLTMQSLQSSASIDAALALVDSINFTLDADINYLADTAAKLQSLQLSSPNNPPAKEMIEATKTQMAAMIPQVVASTPASSLINVTDKTLSSKIEFKDGKFTVNGSPKTTEEILSLLGL